MKQKFKKWKDLTPEEKEIWFRSLKELQSTKANGRKTKDDKQDKDFSNDPIVG